MMKRSWFSVLIIGAVLGLLTVFLGLQYRWLSAASEAERDRMQKRVENDTARFAEDFNREMQAAYYNFQTGADIWKTSNWNAFNERYDFWKERTQYPELIREIYFIDKSSETKPFRYNPITREFEPAETTAELKSLRPLFTDENNFRPVYSDTFSMVLPIFSGHDRVEHVVLRREEKNGGPMPRMPEKSIQPIMRMPEKFGWLVVMLDESVIKDRILPQLAAKYFPDGDYKVAVVDEADRAIFAAGDGAAGADAKAAMFDLSPDNLMFFANREMLPRSAEPHQRSIVVNQRVESHTFEAKTGDGKTGTFKIEMQKAGEKGKPRTAMFAGQTANGAHPWTLSVGHAAGSIDAFVRGERNKSFLIGLGVYLLLVGGIATILLSAMRSKRFARRQIDFVSSVSHEFRTPLAVIYSAGENLADGVASDTGQVSRYGDLIKGEGKKLSRMVEQILEFAGARAGKKKYNFADADPGDVAEDAIRECLPALEGKQFEVEKEIAADLPSVSVDRDALSRAIQNLIQNSIKYSNGSRWLRVTAENGKGSINISVEDGGIGIADSEKKKIFEPFYRSKNVVDAQIHGNGLGLSLVKEIAEAHGGRVSVQSKPGKGSKFTIELPQK